LFSFSTLAILFGLAERAFARRESVTVAVTIAESSLANMSSRQESSSRSSEIWLRDGRSSVLVDTREIIWVGSAGNYVEYAMAAGSRHLIRSTLQQEEARLAAFGIARVHRTRLINLQHIVAITWRKSGDFELSLDTGETIVGSRRHKESIAAISG
jgi:DNA-binding LytR/AlgR family response regulator